MARQPKFREGDQVRAVADTRHGVMNPERYNLGRTGEVVDMARLAQGMGWTYAVCFTGSEGIANTDWMDEECLQWSR